MNSVTSWFGSVQSWVSETIEKADQEYDAEKARQKAPNEESPALTRPLNVSGTNVNPFSKDLTKKADEIKDEILRRTTEISDKTLSNEHITHKAGNPLASSFIFSPSVNPIPSPEHIELQQQTDRELKIFTEAITAYTTFLLLHEWAAGQSSPQNSVIYQTMVQQITKRKQDISMWEIYKNELGNHLGWFAYSKAYVFYYLFYTSSNFIPKLIEELLKSGIQGSREHFAKSQHLSTLFSKILTLSNRLLFVIKGAIDEFIDPNNSPTTTLDEYKKNAIAKEFKSDFITLIKEDSALLIEMFFPHIEFFSPQENVSFFLPDWMTTEASKFLNNVVNLITKTLLKKYIVPSAVRSILSENLTDASLEKSYVFSRALYQFIIDRVGKIQEDLGKEKPPQKRTSPPLHLSDNDHTQLKTLGHCLLDVFDMPDDETPDAIREYKKSTSLIYKKIQPQIISTIAKSGETLINILHDPLTLENSFFQLLKSGRKSFKKKETFDQLKANNEQLRDQLYEKFQTLLNAIVDHTVQEEVKPDIQIKHRLVIFEELKKSAEDNCLQLKILLATMREESHSIHQLLKPQGKFNPGGFVSTAFDAMKNFCHLLNSLILELNIQMIDRKYRIHNMSAEEKNSLNNSLQPLRKQILQLVRSLQNINIQNGHYLCLAIQEKLDRVLDGLDATKRELLKRKPRDFTSTIHENLTEAFKLLRELKRSPENEEQLKASEQLLIQSIQTMAEKKGRREQLNSLISKEPQGLLPNLIFYIMRDGRTPKKFSSIETKQKIEQILDSNFSPEKRIKLKRLIDEIQKYPTSYERKKPKNLRAWILEQADPASDFYQILQMKLRQWSKLPGGKNFDPENWEREVRKYKKYKGALPLLQQVEDFLKKGSMINVYWKEFHREIETRKTELDQENLNIRIKLTPIFEELDGFVKTASYMLQDLERDIYDELTNSIEETDKAIHTLAETSQSSILETPYTNAESTALLTAAAAVTIAAPFVSIIALPAIAAAGAAVGSLTAEKVIPKAKEFFGRKEIVPRILRILKNFFNELAKPKSPFKQLGTYLALEEISNKNEIL
ncbi:MAG: hypothetical protein Q8L98_06320 [Chlamydiales bacterium]|nr:hypothetical protein [Chlamydiales bacterium]